ncbi:MAG: DoxX family protein [Patescibacteria group bacterium]|nr:DoxX family protein [Patescibacteria group bacterium]MDE2015619.1 DoxX family protein [Patescibacteria group bacterium]MDE2226676.1 DoxX family protein [Patescibacteria group bacterium]
MKRWLKVIFLTAGPLFCFWSAYPVYAHENYVLTKEQISAGMSDWSINVWDALRDSHNLAISLEVGAGILAVFVLYFLFDRSRWGVALDGKIRVLEPLGEWLVRFAVGASLIYSAATHVFLGPEIPLASIPGGQIWEWVLYVVGALLILGLFSRVAGAVSLLIISLATIIYRDYMLTYFNYFGEFAALVLFGSYVFSLDRLRAAGKNISRRIKDYETAILRITYGVSVLYPAISIKLLHPIIIVQIVNQYHLNQIHWLFPQDPLLISLGTGLAQILVGLLIIIGFETRLASFATLILYMMSILYFKETVWPHYILLALALYFVINDGGGLTLDAKLKRKSFPAN